jgi:hypothetical protein
MMGALVSTGPEAALLFGTFTRTKTVALRAPVGDFIAVPRVPAQLRAILAPHVTFKLVYRRCLWTPNNVERNRLACVAPEASHLKIEVASVQCVTQGRRRLRRSLEAQHALIPCVTREPISFLAGFLGTLCGRTN